MNEARPFVVCHMLSSLDGKIDGAYFGAPEIGPLLEAFGQIRVEYRCDAALYGATTMAETYAAGYVDHLPEPVERYPRTDYLAPSAVRSFYVAVDPAGSIRWEGKYIEKRGREKSHVIEVLTETVPDRYLAYLHSLDISYVFAGQQTLDCDMLMTKLKEKFGIQRVLLAGGGAVNWTFLQAGLIDELSIVLAPLTDGGRDVATLFDRSAYQPQGVPVGFRCIAVQPLAGDGLWLRYQPKNTR